MCNMSFLISLIIADGNIECYLRLVYPKSKETYPVQVICHLCKLLII